MTQLTRNFLMIILVALTVCGGLVAGYVVYTVRLRASDAFLRRRVVMLSNSANSGECSGVEVIAPKSRKPYILTAGHCFDLLDAGGGTVTLEGGERRSVKFVALDGNSDLLLLTSPSTTGVYIAKATELYEHIHTMTHGGAMPTYRTDGELLDEHSFLMPQFPIVSPDDMAKCAQNPSNQAVPTPFGLVCATVRHQTVGTAAIVPGSSGGPVFNDAGALVGIVSAFGGGFNYYVRLIDIQDFLRGR